MRCHCRYVLIFLCSAMVLIGIGYQKSTYNETISILNYLLNGSVSILSMLLPAVIFIVIF